MTSEEIESLLKQVTNKRKEYIQEGKKLLNYEK